jgi:hypothetical protein
MSCSSLGVILKTQGHSAALLKALSALGEFSLGGDFVFHHGVGDRFGDRVLIGVVVDETGLKGVAQEAAFEEDGGVLDSGEDAVARASDAAIRAAGHEDGGAMDGGSESDVGGVLGVAGVSFEVTCFHATSVVGHSDGGEGEGFDSFRATSAARVEVDADEDGVVDAVGESDPFVQGEVGVGVARHDDFKFPLSEFLAQFAGYTKSVVFLGVILAGDCSGVFAAMAGVDDDGGEGFAASDVLGTQDGVDQFGEIGPGNEITPAMGHHRVAEDELDVIHPDILTADEKAHFDGFILEDKVASRAGEGVEFVEFLDAPDGDVVVPVVFDLFPSSREAKGREDEA